MLRTFLSLSLLTCRVLGTLPAAADPADPAAAATASEPETTLPLDSSDEAAPVTSMPSPATADAPAEPAVPPPARSSVSEARLVAEPPPAEQASSTAQPAAREWYGLPLLIIDSVYLGAMVVGRVAKSDEVVIIGAVGGITNGLLFHTYVYGEGDFSGLGKGLLSVALRGALAGGGCALGSGCGELTNPALIRLSVGTALGAALDAAFLAYRPPSGPPSSPSLRVVPAVSQQAFGGSLVGRF